MIQYFWPTPIYENQVSLESLIQIQSELYKVLSDKKQSNQFNDPWNDNRIQVSNNFKINIFDQYELSNFKQYLNYCIKDYTKILGDDVKDFIISECWMTKSSKNNYGHIHNHMPYDISGVYYLQTCETDGSIFFENPLQICYSSKIGNKNLFNPSYVSKPKNGKIILFPSWLSHGVNTNKTESERISISFNVKILD